MVEEVHRTVSSSPTPMMWRMKGVELARKSRAKFAEWSLPPSSKFDSQAKREGQLRLRQSKARGGKSLVCCFPPHILRMANPFSVLGRSQRGRQEGPGRQGCQGSLQEGSEGSQGKPHLFDMASGTSTALWPGWPSSFLFVSRKKIPWVHSRLQEGEEDAESFFFS